VNVIAHNYTFIDFKQWLTLIFADCFHSAKKLNLIWTPADW